MKSNPKSIALEVVRANGDIEVAETNQSDLLKTLQSLVGGLIESVPMKYDPSHLVIANEEGLLMDLPWNKIASQLTRQEIVGDCVVIKIEDFI
jgi:hypothetical protein